MSAPSNEVIVLDVISGTQSSNQTKRVLVIYTGGTIGSKPKDPDPDSPQIVTTWEDLVESTPELRRVQFPVDCVPFQRPLDSCNVGPAEWAKMAQVIQAHYDKYEGFVLLHGTDTMANTASALSYMLEGLAKPVILTGAQISAMVNVRNDATQNFITALELANPAVTGVPLIPEVCVYFGGRLLRGCRTIKVHTASFTPFDTPNYGWLGAIGQKYSVDVRRLRPKPETAFTPRVKMEPRVIPIDVGPGIQDTGLIASVLALDDIKGVILRAYGTGDLPTKPEFLDALRTAREKGKVVAVVTQCPEGPVELGIYDTSAQLVEAGLVAGYDITPQAAHAKLMSLLGNPDLDQAEVEQRFQRSLVGEQSRSLWLTAFEGTGSVKTDGGVLPNQKSLTRMRGRALQGDWRNSQIVTATLRLRNARFAARATDEIQFRILMNWEEGLPLDATFVRARRTVPAQPGLVILDVTSLVKPVAQPGRNMSFTIALLTPDSEISWDGAELAIISDEIGV